MQVLYDVRFGKDLSALNEKKIKIKVEQFILKIKASEDFSDFTNIKKLKGEAYAYRWKTGNYRLGFEYDGQKVTFVRFLHRKDIYKSFP